MAAQPGAAWLREERAALALRTQDWREALALSAPGGNRAQLALAAARQEPDAARAAEYEKQAVQADPGFAPAGGESFADLVAQGSLGWLTASGTLERYLKLRRSPATRAANAQQTIEFLRKIGE